MGKRGNNCFFRLRLFNNFNASYFSLANDEIFLNYPHSIYGVGGGFVCFKSFAQNIYIPYNSLLHFPTNSWSPSVGRNNFSYKDLSKQFRNNNRRRHHSNCLSHCAMNVAENNSKLIKSATCTLKEFS